MELTLAGGRGEVLRIKEPGAGVRGVKARPLQATAAEPIVAVPIAPLVLRFDRAGIGPLKSNEPYLLDVGGTLEGAEYRIVVDDEPATDFVEKVPLFYPPGYSFFVASLGGVFPLGAPLGRAVSVTATLAAVVALHFFSWRRYRAIRHGRATDCAVATRRAPHDRNAPRSRRSRAHSTSHSRSR